MKYMFLIAISGCSIHKTSLSGVIDHSNGTECAIELDSGKVVIIKSNGCKTIKEGSEIIMYIKEKK